MAKLIWQLKADPKVHQWQDAETGLATGWVGSQPSGEFYADDWTLLPYSTADEYEASLAKPKPTSDAKAQYEALVAVGINPELAANAVGYKI